MQSGPVGGDEERGHAAGSGGLAGAGEDRVEVGPGRALEIQVLVPVSRQPSGLPARVVVAGPAVRFRVQCQRCRVTACAGLAQREGRDRPARGDGGQPAGPLLGCPGVGNRPGAQSLEGEGRLGLRAGVGQRLTQQAQVERAAATPRRRRGNGAGEQSQCAQFAEQGAVDAPVLAPGGERGELFSERAQAGAPGALLRGECEGGGHGGSPRPWPVAEVPRGPVPVLSPTPCLSRTIDCRHQHVTLDATRRTGAAGGPRAAGRVRRTAREGVAR